MKFLCPIVLGLSAIGICFGVILATQIPVERIKGNVPSMVYHLPDCLSYGSVQINEEEGDMFFKTQDEAEAAGFQKAKNCP